MTTRHGVVLIPDAGDGPVLKADRLIIPGAKQDTAVDPPLHRWAATHDTQVTTLVSTSGHGGFDGALEDLARTTDRATAISTAKRLDYPTHHLSLQDTGTAWRAPALFGATLLVAALASMLPRTAIRTWRLIGQRRRRDCARTAQHGVGSGRES